ncbi:MULTISPECIES: hypothetical protein [unclassified Phyllobacterium]|uniref:hypothetical protein n=1 Tax=unclassified Phyllobacterium TaxID=2638441 RepID=UPI003012A944
MNAGISLHFDSVKEDVIGSDHVEYLLGARTLLSFVWPLLFLPLPNRELFGTRRITNCTVILHFYYKLPQQALSEIVAICATIEIVEN